MLDSSAQSTNRPLRIGLFTHSTNPRGGGVHVLELAAALGEMGHHVVVHVPDVSGDGFFRPAPAKVMHALIPAMTVVGDLSVLVRQRVAEYGRYLGNRGREFDIYHAHDGISGNALADLAEVGLIPGFLRTVHHLDAFTNPFLASAQNRSIAAAARCLCVSGTWHDTIKKQYGIDAAIVPNGVDTRRFNPNPRPGDEPTRRRLIGAAQGPVFLAVGGVERRKNACNILRAFAAARLDLPKAILVIVGGASLLDHSDYRKEFERELALLSAAPFVHLARPIGDSDMPAIYRMADALVFPSTTEGFGLAVIEAMASGTPVITSRIPPFTEYLGDDDALLVDPRDVDEIAGAMRQSVDGAVRDRLRARGLAVAARFPWSASATAHLHAYGDFLFNTGVNEHAGNEIQSALAG